jgi:hypothetical protein
MTTWKCGTPRRGAAFGVHRVKKGQVDVVCLLLDQGSEHRKKEWLSPDRIGRSVEVWETRGGKITRGGCELPRQERLDPFASSSSGRVASYLVT